MSARTVLYQGSQNVQLTKREYMKAIGWEFKPPHAHFGFKVDGAGGMGGWGDRGQVLGIRDQVSRYQVSSR